MTNLREITNEDLASKFRTERGDIWFDYRQELLRRLGAAVSASPQPRCPVCQNKTVVLMLIGGNLVVGCPKLHQVVIEQFECDGNPPTWPLVDFAQFFAAAPAQERWYTKAELHDALIARNYEPKIADELAGWFADQLELAYKKGKERAQEQPVENSPQKGKP